MADPFWVIDAKERIANIHIRVVGDAHLLEMALAEREKLLDLLRLSHGAIDELMARVIGLDPSFRPTKWERWPTIVAMNEVLK